MSYQVMLYSPAGVRLASLGNFASLTYARTINNVGTLTLVLPDIYDPTLSLFAEDSIITVERSVGAGSLCLDMDTYWWIRKPTRTLDESGLWQVQIEAYDTLHLLWRRIVSYAQGTAYTAKAGYADNVMKAIIRENFSALATDAARQLAATLLTVQPDLALGQVVYKEFHYQKVGDVLKEIADHSTQTGTYLAFDLVTSGVSSPLEFQTYSTQRGLDHRRTAANPVIFGPAYGNIASIEKVYDYSQEVNAVYCAGQGEGASRPIVLLLDTARIGMSPFNRMEAFVDAGNTIVVNEITSMAYAALRMGRPRRLYTAEMVNTPGTQYGLHWKYGDYVTVDLGPNEQFDCHLDAVAVTVDQSGLETIEAVLKNDQ